MTTAAGALFGNDFLHKDKALIIDLTIVNLYNSSSNLESTARQTGKHLTDAVGRKKNKYWGSFPTTYSPLILIMSMFCEPGPDACTHPHQTKLGRRRVHDSTELHSEES